ncbi:MAG TPA: serine protease [Chthoniobacteraceae bacterium]|nr:serine protease [Chthoniobacteraceae bacterium]
MKYRKLVSLIVAAVVASATACFSIPLMADEDTPNGLVGAWHIYQESYEMPAPGSPYGTPRKLVLTFMGSAVFIPHKTAFVKMDGGPMKELRWKAESKYLTVIDQQNTVVWYLALPLDPKGTKGALKGSPGYNLIAFKEGYESVGTANGGAAAGAATGSASPSPAPVVEDEAAKKAAADIVSAYTKSLVFVNGKEGSGSGFIATMGAGQFLITNAHVATAITDAGFKTLDGTDVKGGSPALAVGADILCMQMPAGAKPFEIMQEVDKNTALGDAVAVLGNSGGQGVINIVTGKIVGYGPNLVEVDAPFIPGNSGSPIIHLKSGKVIGVATYETIKRYDDTTDEKLAKPIIRRFGYRLDSVKQWQGVDWRSFYAQASALKAIKAFTGDLDHFLDELYEYGAVAAGDDYSSPAINNRIEEWEADRGSGLNAVDKKNIDANFYSAVRASCQADVAAARRQMFYDYFQRGLGEQQEIRDGMTKALDRVIKSLGD